MKTLIELFDGCQTENVIAGLRFKPQKIVYVGFKEVMTKKKMRTLNDFFAMKGLSAKIEYEIVGRYDYDAIVEKLEAIVERNEDCCFELTGGKDLVLAAMGAVSATRNVPMFQLNVRTGNFINVKNCDGWMETEKLVMSLSESVALNGCSVIYGEKEDFKWKLTADFKRDLEILWNICKRNCGLWNKQSCVFESFEKYGNLSDDFEVTVNLKHMKDGNHDVMLNNRIINELVNNGLILNYSLADDVLSFRYKNEQIHQCISKAGNILELYGYMLFKEIAEEDPGYYDDIDIGVYIDWDGVVHDGLTEVKDTKNEIDIMLMRDLVPIFVSCKNGEVNKEALYELETVADKFGGKYAKKYLLTSYISTDSEKRKYIEQRAADMNITVIDGVYSMSRDEMKSALKRVVK